MKKIARVVCILIYRFFVGFIYFFFFLNKICCPVASPAVGTLRELSTGCFVAERANQSINYLKCRYVFFFFKSGTQCLPSQSRIEDDSTENGVDISTCDESLI